MSCLKYTLECGNTLVTRDRLPVATIHRSPLGRSVTIHPMNGQSFTSRELDGLLSFMLALESGK